MHLADGNIPVQRSRLPDSEKAVDRTVEKMSEMSKGEYGSRSAKIRALAINIINAANVKNKDYYGMIEAIHNWVRDTIRYVKDPVSQETLSYPEETAFNSKAGDCDDMTILEMALLGSIGIRSYPVVIGLVPNHYSHVYLNVMVPTGKGAHAGEVIPADPIMREWPLGKEAPAHKVKAKKLYSELSGLGAMLNGYADASDYLDLKNLASIAPALASRVTDSSGHGVTNTKQVVAHGETTDDIFGPGPNMPGRNNPVGVFKQAGKESLFARGPIVALSAENHTSYLHAKPVRPMRARMKILTVKMPMKKSTEFAGPTIGELIGLSDYISALTPAAKKASRFSGVTGRGDVLHHAVAAAHYAGYRAHRANKRKQAATARFAVDGLGGPVTPELLKSANDLATLAASIADKANALVVLATGNSPLRKQAVQDTAAVFNELEQGASVGAAASSIPTENGYSWYDDAKNKISTLHEAAFDSDLRRAVHQALSEPVAKGKSRGTVIKNPLPSGSVVRDHNGDLVQDRDELGSFFSKIKKKLKKVAPKVLRLSAGVATAGTSEIFRKTAPGKKFAAKIEGRKIAPKKKAAVTAAGTQEMIYEDANGNKITKAQYDALMAQYNQGTPIIAPSLPMVAPTSTVPGDTNGMISTGSSMPVPASSMPIDTFGPEDMGPASEDGSTGPEEDPTGGAAPEGAIPSEFSPDEGPEGVVDTQDTDYDDQTEGTAPAVDPTATAAALPAPAPTSKALPLMAALGAAWYLFAHK